MTDFTKPHRRRNPLSGEWILVSPHRAKRPWNGAIEQTPATRAPSHDPSCYLCPGVTRANGEKNPEYTESFIFDNDHPALIPDVPIDSTDEPNFITTQEYGTSHVMCYCADHGKTMASMSIQEISAVISRWKIEYETIGKDPRISYVQIFENKGPAMGASSPHPHCQIWATEHIPTIPAAEQLMQEKTPELLLSYEASEQTKKERIIYATESFTLLVPFWAVWPFETMIVPRAPLQSLSQLTQLQQNDLALVISTLTASYDKIFSTSFPYSMGIHQAPTDGTDHLEWQFHMHFYPPLLRSATIKKYYVGYELMAEAQRDISPESAAETIRRYI